MTGKLNLPQLAAATYLMASGGPYGLEELVQNAGYRWSLLILIVIPLVWSLPVGLMVGELSTAIPEDGGFYVWVTRALGPFWGFQEAWLSLAASVFDMAAYPTIFVLSLGQLWPPATEGHNGFLIGVSLVAVGVLWNLFGARAVGEGSVVIGVIILIPFVAIAVLGFLRDGSLASVPHPHQPEHRDFLAAILVAMWNYMGWDNASTVAAEVERPQQTYSRVIMIAIGITALTYIIPVLAIWRTGLPVASWATGGWVSIASLLGGRWFSLAMLLTTMISVFGTFDSLTLSYSRLPAAMAEMGYAPRISARRWKNGVPWVSVLMCGAAWATALGLSFDRLLILDILLYGASLLLEFVALIRLRLKEPELYRPFSIPGGSTGAVLASVGPAALLLVVAIKCGSDRAGSSVAVSLALSTVALGVIGYFPLSSLLGRRTATVRGQPD